MKYRVEYWSHTQSLGVIDSDSRDARKHGVKLLGSAGGGIVQVYRGGSLVSMARFSPENGGKWYNVTIKGGK